MDFRNEWPEEDGVYWVIEDPSQFARPIIAKVKVSDPEIRCVDSVIRGFDGYEDILWQRPLFDGKEYVMPDTPKWLWFGDEVIYPEVNKTSKPLDSKVKAE